MKLKQETIQILKKNCVSLVLQFGSSVAGGGHPGSNVDVGFCFETIPSPEQTPEAYHDLRIAFSKEFPDKDVDIIFLHEAPLRIQYRAGQSGVILCARTPEDYANYLERSILAYLDFKPVEQQLHSAMLEAVSAQHPLLLAPMTLPPLDPEKFMSAFPRSKNVLLS